MRNAQFAVLLALTATLLLPSAATAAPTLRLSVPVNETFFAPGLTELCGVPVWIHGLTGFAAPGFPGAGRIVYEGVVFDTSDGLPHLDWPTAVRSIVGSSTRGVDPIAERCAFLAGH